MTPRYIIGIDPDHARSGVAVLDTRTSSLTLETMDFPHLLDVLVYYRDSLRLEGKGERPLVVVEAGWLNKKSNFHGYAGRRGEKIAKDVGANHETGRKILEMCRHWGIDCEERAPLLLPIGGVNLWSGHDGKISHEDLKAIAGSSLKALRTNQEERDAALIALSRAGFPITLNKRKQTRI